MNTEESKTLPPFIESGGDPLPLEKVEKLKIFAISSCKLDAEPEKLRAEKKLFLTLLSGYSINDAIAGTAEGLRQNGVNPANYMVGFQMVVKDADQIIDLSSSHSKTVEKQKEYDINQEIKKVGIEKYMIENVRRIFEIAGTDSQKSIAENVIKKFEEYVEKQKNNK